MSMKRLTVLGLATLTWVSAASAQQINQYPGRTVTPATTTSAGSVVRSVTNGTPVPHQAVEQACNPCGRCGGLTAGLEIPLFQVFANHGAGETNGGNGWFDGDNDTTGAARMWIGYENACGAGFRAGYFNFESNFDDVDEFFDVELADIERQVSLDVKNYNVDLFGGVRWGSMDWSREDGGPGFNFEGTGITLGAEVSRPFWRCLSMFAGVRQSFLYGETRELSNDDTAENVAVPITELRVGTEICRQLRSGSSLILRFAWENQTYYSLSGNVDNDIDPEDVDISLAGPAFALILAR
jgi:hypothetical protein